ncbi:MAG: protein kinase domain-containing protein [Pseudonocardiaceae bacterium]
MVGWSVPGVVHLRQVREDPVGRRVIARHRISRKPLAITYLSPEFLADDEFHTRFRDDSARLSQVRDSRVVRTRRYVEGDHGAAVISDYVSGTTLRALLLAQGAVGTAAALVVLKDALLALAACHKAGLAHGDIKPENVMLTSTGRVRLVDVGLWTSEGRRQLARSTPFYLAPEQWGGPPVSQAGDIYAATATFFECLVGTPPFYADGAAELSAKHHAGGAPVEVVPEPVRQLVVRGLAKDPHSRSGARSLLTLVGEVATRDVGPGWERWGRRELAALLASRSALSAVPAASRRTGRAGGLGYGKPVRMAAVIGGALALAAGLSSPPLAVLPDIGIFGSGARPPVLAFPEPDQGAVAVRAVTNGPLADRVPAGTAKVRTGTPLLAPSPSAPNIQTAPHAPAGPAVQHPGAGYPGGVAPDRPAPDQATSATSACTRVLIDNHQPCTAVKPETPGSAGSTTDSSEVTIPVSLPVQLPVPVQLPTQVEIPVRVPVQLPAPAQPAPVPQSIPKRDQPVPGWGSHVQKDFQAQLDSQGSRKMTRSTDHSFGQPSSHPERGFGNSSGARNSGNR